MKESGPEHQGCPRMSWKWAVCGLLLLASAVNYMDRQTLANASVRITRELGLTDAEYGRVEGVFGYAFALGSVVFGWMADRRSLRGLYAAVLASWSVAGMATGFVGDGTQLFWCRAALGFFEAGHWPCAIRTTRLLLEAKDRPLGNGLLQGGASVGAIVTPLVMLALMGTGAGEWRRPFVVVGAAGLAWLVPWLWLVRDSDLGCRPAAPPKAFAGLGELLASRRMWLVLATIACINTTWQVMRAWLPKFLQQGRGLAESNALWFNSAWFLMADVGCIGAGALVTWLVMRGRDAHGARLGVFGCCAALCAVGVAIPWLPAGPWLLGALGMVAAGSLGVFPLYHAFTQELPASRQGLVTGLAGVAGWIMPAQAQQALGQLATRTGSLDAGLALAALLPLVPWILLAFAWGMDSREGRREPQAS